MINKTNVQRMVDFLESAPPIEMSSHCNCAAHQIAEQVFQESVADDFARSVRVICRLTGIPSTRLESIFMVGTARYWMELFDHLWVYDVKEAKDVTNQMVADQLKKYL